MLAGVEWKVAQACGVLGEEGMCVQSQLGRAGRSCESLEFAGGELGLDPRPQGQWEAGNAIPFQPVNPLHCRKGLPFPPQHSLLADGV